MKYSNVIQVSVDLLFLTSGDCFMDSLQIELQFWGTIICSLVVIMDVVVFPVNVQHTVPCVWE